MRVFRGGCDFKTCDFPRLVRRNFLTNLPIALFTGKFIMWTAVNGLWSQWKQRLPTSVQGLPRFDLLPSLRNRRKNHTEILLMSFDLVWSFSSSGHCIAFVSYLVWWCNLVELRVKTAFYASFFEITSINTPEEFVFLEFVFLPSDTAFGLPLRLFPRQEIVGFRRLLRSFRKFFLISS